jgi:putative phosphoribosyl transferase
LEAAMIFENRREAGKRLAGLLREFADVPDILVLGLPRGGVPVAYEVAKALHAPLDVFVVRKLGVPGQEELAFGAIATGGVRILNPAVMEQAQITDEELESVTAEELRELTRREQAFRGDRPAPQIRGRTVILIDDGLATGATMRAAVMALSQQQPARIVAAVPAAAPETCEAVREHVDELVCAVTPDPFYSVGSWYEDFSQTTDEEVHELLSSMARSES